MTGPVELLAEVGREAAMAGRSISVCAALASWLAAGCLACTHGFTARDDATLPPRTQSVDTSLVTPAASQSGFSAFVSLTGLPNSSCLSSLAKAGLDPPHGHATIVTFPALALPTVWGFVRAGALQSIASLAFVTRIEPSTDSTGIGYESAPIR